MQQPDEERGGPRQGRPPTPPTSAIVADWADIYGDAERWVAWTARRRWPEFAVNDQVWACSATAWETYGRRVAA